MTEMGLLQGFMVFGTGNPIIWLAAWWGWKQIKNANAAAEAAAAAEAPR